jgi:hypothetical protein
VSLSCPREGGHPVITGLDDSLASGDYWIMRFRG